MRALFGEKNIMLFPQEIETSSPIAVNYKEFFETYQKNTSQIILDKSCVVFSLDHLKNTNIYDAFKSLQCKKQFLSENEKAYLVKKEKLVLFSKSDFYTQTNVINGVDLFQKISNTEIFLIEHAICELCKSVAEIKDNTWWLYVAQHRSSGIKIVAGVGNGIAYSRSFANPDETEKKVVETIRFLTREGLDSSIKIISFIDNLYIDSLDIVNPPLPKADIETILVEIIATNKNIEPQFSKDSYAKRFFNNHSNEIFSLFTICIFICLFTLICLYNQSATLVNSIEIEKEKLDIFVKDKSKTFSARISRKNINNIQQLVEIFQQIQNPLHTIESISKILSKQKADEISIEGNSVKIQCTMNDREINQLRNSVPNAVDVKKNDVGDEYEYLDNSENKKYSVKICIKTK